MYKQLLLAALLALTLCQVKHFTQGNSKNVEIIEFITDDPSDDRTAADFEVAVQEERESKQPLNHWRSSEWVAPKDHKWQVGEKFVFEHRFVSDCVTAPGQVIVHAYSGFRIWANGKRMRVYDNINQQWRTELSGGDKEDGEGIWHDRFNFDMVCGENVIKIEVHNEDNDDHPAVTFIVLTDGFFCDKCLSKYYSWSASQCKCDVKEGYHRVFHSNGLVDQVYAPGPGNPTDMVIDFSKHQHYYWDQSPARWVKPNKNLPVGQRLGFNNWHSVKGACGKIVARVQAWNWRETVEIAYYGKRQFVGTKDNYAGEKLHIWEVEIDSPKLPGDKNANLGLKIEDLVSPTDAALMYEVLQQDC